MARADGRRWGELRPIEIVRGFTRSAPGSVLIRCGQTHVLCTACFESGAPKWKAGSGSGWCTAEYDMLPGSTSERRMRNRGKIDGRTQEIQRLIGRALRAVIDLDALGENSILVDCDVLQADGGTRTASITGAYVAVCDAVNHACRVKLLDRSPLRDSVAAVSVGLHRSRAMLDLDYQEDVETDVDLNVVMTGAGRLIEVQGTGERHTFTRAELTRMVNLAAKGIREITSMQNKALKRRMRITNNPCRTKIADR